MVGDKPSTGHGMEYYSFETSSDWTDGALNGLNKYPEEGAADVAVGMQWNLGDLGPGRSWQINITFYFGGSAGIYVDAGPHQTVGLGRPVRLDASRSTSVGTITSYEWDLNGDGIYEVNVSSPVYEFPGWTEPGEHSVTLRATDNDGRNATASTVITVASGTLEGFNDTFKLSLSPERAATSPGGEAGFTIDLSNDQAAPDSLELNLTGVARGWISLPESVDLAAGEESQIALQVSVPDDAPDSNNTLLLRAFSRNLGGSKETRASLNVTSAPMLSDLLPLDNARTGSEEVLVSWKTPVNASSEVFVRSEAAADFRRISGAPGEEHAVKVGGLARNSLYEYYVRSETPRGASQSDVRRIFIDNGISFDRKAYNFSIERDYNQSVFIDVKNTDTKPHELLMQVSGVPQDLALNFVGEGSVDQRIALLPGEARSIELVFHAQDALSEEYSILMNLTNLGAEPITDSAVVNLKVHFPVIDYSIEEVKSDPYTLAKTLRITNRGDPLSDLSVSASRDLADLLVFSPSVDHSYLGTGQSLEFVAEPVLYEGFTGAEGAITASAAGASRNLSVQFAVPPGKSIFVGQQPEMAIAFDKEFDDDGLANTNPSGEVESYTFKSNNKTAEGFIARIKVKVEQNAAPAYKAQVVLNLSGNGNYTTIRSMTDLWGQTIFAIYGLAGEYSYQASVEASNASTDRRTFTVSSTPSRTLEPGSVVWISAKDANGTTDLSAPDSTAPLSAPPYAIKAKKPGLTAGSTPVLYLANAANYSFVEVVGEARGEELVFNLGYVDPGNYTAAIAIQSSSGIATSEKRALTFTVQGDDITFQNNYTYEMPYPINSSAVAKLTINNTLAAGDPHKVVRLLYVLPDENRTKYIFTYLVMADHNTTDTLRLTAKDKNGKVVYEENRQVELAEMEPLFLDAPVPVYYEDGQRIEGLKMELEMQDYVLFFSDVWYLICDPGAFVDGETWKNFLRNGVLTPNNMVGVGFKCFAGFVPGVNTVVTAVDLINNGGNFVVDLYTGKPFEGQTTLGPAIGGIGQLALDPLLDLNEGQDTYQMILRDKFPIEAVKKIRGQLLGKPPKEQVKILLGEYKKQFMTPLAKDKKMLTRVASGIGILANFYSNYDDWKRVTEDQAKNSQSGQVKSQSISVKSCINHAPLKNKFETPGYIIPSGSSGYRPTSAGWPGRLVVQSVDSSGNSSAPSVASASESNIDGVYVRLFFAREPPAGYKPFNTVVKLNGHVIGRINNTVPGGNYVFRADPAWLNYAERGAAENTVTLDVDGMNRGYYVPLDGYKIDILFKSMRRAVCASSQEEADSAALNLSGAMGRQADLVLTSHDISVSNPQPMLGENITIDANVHNLGSMEVSGAQVQLLVDDKEIDSQDIIYMAMYSNETVSFPWQAEAGAHNIKVVVDPLHDINESDYANNEASRTITVTGPDSSLPAIGNIQPPEGSTLTYNLPLISADLSDEGSGINASAVRISVDGADVTANATVIPSRVWYTPAEPLSSGSHQVRVKAEDRQGNAAEKSWSFAVSSDSTPPEIANPQPPDGATVGEARPLFSAVLKDADSGVNTASVKMEVDGLDVTSKATILPIKVWYTPDQPLAAGEHRAAVKAKDNQGNEGSLEWSFLVREGAGPVVGPRARNVTVCSAGCGYTRIQDAVDAASPGSTVEVQAGTYRENVNISKPLMLKGTGLPLIDASGKGSAITLSRDGITLEGFRIANAAEAGIEVMSNGNTVKDNEVSDNLGYGIHFNFASNNTVMNNSFQDNGFGIYLGDMSNNNTVANNSARRNDYGIYIDLGSFSNVLYQNSLRDNRAHDAYDFDTDLVSPNQWDNGSIGNYYSDMDCTDSEGDGICDSTYSIPGGLSLDRYPRASEEVVRTGRQPAIISPPPVIEVPEPGPSLGTPVFSDDFSDPQTGLSRYSTKDVTNAYDGGRYHITVVPADYYSYSSYTDKEFADLDLQVEAAKEEGPEDGSYGLILRLKDKDNFYWFEVSADGRYRFMDRKEGSWFTIIDWTPSDAIRQGSQTNLLRATAKGDKFTFYINGKNVATAIDSSFVSGRVGVFVATTEEGGVHASFDNFKVWSGEGTPGVVPPVITISAPGPEKGPARVISHGMSKDIESNAATETAEFSTLDTSAVSWIEIGPLYGSHQVDWYWYSPDGSLYDVYGLQTPDPKSSGQDYFPSRKVYSSMEILGSDAMFLPGVWRVDVFIDGAQALTEEFPIRSFGNEGITINIDAPPGGWEMPEGIAL